MNRSLLCIAKSIDASLLRCKLQQEISVHSTRAVLCGMSSVAFTIGAVMTAPFAVISFPCAVGAVYTAACTLNFSEKRKPYKHLLEHVNIKSNLLNQSPHPEVDNNNNNQQQVHGIDFSFAKEWEEYNKLRLQHKLDD